MNRLNNYIRLSSRLNRAMVKCQPRSLELAPQPHARRLATQTSTPIEHIIEDFQSDSGILTMYFNRPNKRNAITEDMYKRITHVSSIEFRRNRPNAVVVILEL